MVTPGDHGGIVGRIRPTPPPPWPGQANGPPLQRIGRLGIRWRPAPGRIPPIQMAPTRPPEFPAPAGVVPGMVSAQKAMPTVLPHHHILQVHMQDAVRKPADKLRRVDPLPDQVTWIQGETQFMGAVQRLKDGLRAAKVECHLTGMDLQRVTQAQLPQFIQDRLKAPRKIGQRRVDFIRFGPRIPGDTVPDCRAGEPCQQVGSQPCGDPGGRYHLRGCPLPDPLGITITPDMFGQQVPHARVVSLADGGARPVAGDRGHLQPRFPEHIHLRFEGPAFTQGPLDLQMVAPACQFHRSETPAPGHSGQFREGQIGPRAGEKGKWAAHGFGSS